MDKSHVVSVLVIGGGKIEITFIYKGIFNRVYLTIVELIEQSEKFSPRIIDEIFTNAGVPDTLDLKEKITYFTLLTSVIGDTGNEQ